MATEVRWLCGIYTSSCNKVITNVSYPTKKKNKSLGSSRCILQRLCWRCLHRKGLLVGSSVQGIISQDIWTRPRTRPCGHTSNVTQPGPAWGILKLLLNLKANYSPSDTEKGSEIEEGLNEREIKVSDKQETTSKFEIYIKNSLRGSKYVTNK
jgi:hypothetical protein